MNLQIAMTLDQFLNICNRISNSIWVRNYIVTESEHLVMELADLHSEGFDTVDIVLRSIGFEFRESLMRRSVACRTYSIVRTYSNYPGLSPKP